MRTWIVGSSYLAFVFTALFLGAAPAHACTNPGDTCADGTIYAGLSPDGNVPMFTTPTDAPTMMPWNNGNSTNFTDTTMINCTSGTPGAQSSCQTGEANTAILVVEDSNGGAVGIQSHQAAAYCNSLSAHGHNDWYLAAQDELDVLYDNKNAGDLNGTFNESGTSPMGWYWSSSEHDSNSARLQRFDTGTAFPSGKINAVAVRCIRKSPLPDCLDPNGTIGQITYNATHDVFQACTRNAGWVALHAQTPDPCLGGPIGTRCASDGAIYAGDTVGGARMYAAACDHGMTWDGMNCSGSRTPLAWKTTNTTTAGTTSLTDGVANTDAMATAGTALHPAAEACRNMGPEWYLPARDELDLLYDNLVDQDGDSTPGGPLGSIFYFNTAGSFYYSSSEYSSQMAWRVRFTDGAQNIIFKTTTGLPFRCVRKYP